MIASRISSIALAATIFALSAISTPALAADPADYVMWRSHFGGGYYLPEDEDDLDLLLR